MGDETAPSTDTPSSTDADRAASAAVHDSFFDSSGLASAEIDLATGRFVRANKKFCRLVGYTVAELLGELRFLDITHRDDRAEYLAVIAALHHDKTDDFAVDTRYIRKDGQEIEVRLFGAMIEGPEPAARRLTASAVVITTSKGAEARLHASEADFRAAFTHSAVPMAQVSATTGTFVRVNDKYCELTGYSAAELAQMAPDDLTFAPDRAVDSPAVAELLRGAVPAYEREKRYVRKDGKILWVHISATLLRDADGRPERTMSVIQDITDRKQSEAERIRLLHQAEWERGRLADVFRHAPVFMCVSRGPEHVFELMNDRYTQLIGDRQTQGRTARAVFPELEGQGFFELLDGVYATGEPYVGVDVRVWLARNPDEPLEERVVDFVYQPLRDASNTVTGVVAVGVDVTHRSRAEAALRSSEAKYRTLFDSIDQGYCVIEMIFDDTGKAVDYRFEEINPAFEKQSGLVGAPGRTMLELVPEMEPQWFERYGRVVQTGEPLRFINVAEAMGRWFDGFAFRLGGAGSHKVAVLFSDITAQHQAHNALRESEERYRAATVAVSGVIWTNNAEGLMEGEQRAWAEFTGQSPEQYRGYGWSKAIHPDDAQPTIDAWQRAVAEKRTFVFEHRVRRHDGEWRICSIRAISVVNPDGSIRGWVGVHTDITERKRDEDRLQHLAADLAEADRRKNEFLATLAHELRNPLAPIRTGLDVMRMSPSGTPAVEKVRAIMERQLVHMVRLVDDLMDVSRIGGGKVELKVARVHAGAVLDHAVEGSRPLIDSGGHTLLVNAVAELAWVDGDLTRLAQVVSNLLNNAAKYTPAGGRIELSAFLDGSEVAITVTDNGVGISAEMIPKVFDLFAQVDRTLGRAQGGLGIGLSVVRSLVELHGGTVTAASPGVGRGSTFTVRLPLAAAVELSTKDNSSTARQTAGLRVLVVDDNVDGAEMLSTLLELAGHKTTTVHDGPSALAAAADVRPDVVLLDIGLPGMNGHEVARCFRAEALFRGIVLVALTGWGSEEDQRKSREAGFDHHLTKPVDFTRVEELLAGIQGAVR